MIIYSTNFMSSLIFRKVDIINNVRIKGKCFKLGIHTGH